MVHSDQMISLEDYNELRLDVLMNKNVEAVRMSCMLDLHSARQGDKAPAIKLGEVVIRRDRRNFLPAEAETLLGGPHRGDGNACLGAVVQLAIDVAEMVAETFRGFIGQQHAPYEK